MKRKYETDEVPFKYVIIGGGISGVCCAEELARIADTRSPNEICIISASELLLQTSSVNRCSVYLEELQIYEKTADEFSAYLPNVKVLIDSVQELREERKNLVLKSGMIVRYEVLCICTGVKPKLIAHHPLILGIRDFQSVRKLKTMLRKGKRVAIIGNGGIAMELVHELSSVEVTWIVREQYMGSALFDRATSDHLLPLLSARLNAPPSAYSHEYDHDDEPQRTCPNEHQDSVERGYGLGPEWLKRGGVDLSEQSSSFNPKRLEILFGEAVVAYSDNLGATWTPADGAVFPIASPSPSSYPTYPCPPLWLLTSKGSIVAVDFAVSATGVVPDLPFLESKDAVTGVKLDEEGFIWVKDITSSRAMQTSLPDIFAAGDCCSYVNSQPDIPYFQMRLWTQARHMGVLAAQGMVGEGVQDDRAGSLALELFAHITRFMDRKVVLLGRYNAQGLQTDKLGQEEGFVEEVVRSVPLLQQDGDQYELHELKSSSSLPPPANVEILLRSTPIGENGEGGELVKVVLKDGRVQGALLVGDTELEEAMENLILNRINIHHVGIDLLNPDLDIGDYFD